MRLHPKTEAELSPCFIALLIDVGWLDIWPLYWTKGGTKAVRNKYVGGLLWKAQNTATKKDGRLIIETYGKE